MKNIERGLPDNPIVLKHLLSQANDTVKWFDASIAEINYNASELECVVTNPTSYLRRRKYVGAMLLEMRKRRGPNGPDIVDLERYLPPFPQIADCFEAVWQAHERWESIVSTGEISVEVFSEEAPASYEVANALEGVNDLFRRLRSQIIAKLAGGNSGVPALTTNSTRLPRTKRVFDLGRAVRDSRNADKSKRQIALELADGNQKSADSSLRQLRRFPELNSRTVRPASDNTR